MWLYSNRDNMQHTLEVQRKINFGLERYGEHQEDNL